jgi:hypothetical protein
VDGRARGARAGDDEVLARGGVPANGGGEYLGVALDRAHGWDLDQNVVERELAREHAGPREVGAGRGTVVDIVEARHEEHPPGRRAPVLTASVGQARAKATARRACRLSGDTPIA